MTNLKGFNIRIYGVCFDDEKRILVSDEFHSGMFMTKFPGGGMIPGESTVGCLKREILEETGDEIIVKDHIYTTDYFQPAIFMSDYQLVSIYYYFEFKNKPSFKTTAIPFDFNNTEGNQSFRWIENKNIHPGLFTLPIDKKVAGIIMNNSHFISK